MNEKRVARRVALARDSDHDFVIRVSACDPSGHGPQGRFAMTMSRRELERLRDAMNVVLIETQP